MGNVDLQATILNKFIIKVLPTVALESFDKDTNYSWNIASVSGSFQNFSADRIALDYTAVTNDLAGGKFAAGEGVVSFIRNRAPTAGLAIYPRTSGNPVSIPISHLINNFTSDLDSDARQLISIGSGTNDANIVIDNGFIVYTPSETDPNRDTADHFTYTIRDTRDYRPGDTVRTATGIIRVVLPATYATAGDIFVDDGKIHLLFSSVEAGLHNIERTVSLNEPIDWVVIASTNVPSGSVFGFTDEEPTNPAFYRAVKP